MVFGHSFKSKTKHTLKRRKGDAVLSLVGLFCACLGMATTISVTTWLSAQRAATRASVYLSIHNLNCMERLGKEAKGSTSQLLEMYTMGEYSSQDIDTTIKCTPFEVEGVNGYTVRINSHFRSSPYRLSSTYVLTALEQEDTLPEVNPE